MCDPARGCEMRTFNDISLLIIPRDSDPARSLTNSANLLPSANPAASSPGSNNLTSAANFHVFQTSIVNHFQKGADGEDLSQSFSQRLKALMPESVFSSHAANLQITVSQHQPSAAVDFLNLTLFMMSNQFLKADSDISTKVNSWIKRRSKAGFLEYLLSVDGPTTGALGEQLFSIAIEEEDPSIVKKILDAGLNPNELRCSSSWGIQITALQRACELRSLEVVRALSSAGADVNSSPSGDYFPLTCAVNPYDEESDIQDHVEIELVQALLHAGAKVNLASDESPLSDAASSCHVELVVILLSEGADPNFSNQEEGITPLMAAVQSNGSVSDIVTIVRYLLQAGANVNAASNNGGGTEMSTVLENALYTDSVNLIQVLLARGAYVTDSVLTYAVGRCEKKVVKLFIRAGARVTRKAIKAAASKAKCEFFWHLLESVDDGMKEWSRSWALSAAYNMEGKI